jgi:type 1 glutamine amidotransferase
MTLTQGAIRMHTTRRTLLRTAAAVAAGAFVSPLLSLAQTPGGGKKVLFFTRSQGFPHSVVTRKNPDELAFAEALFKEIATKAGYDVTVSKDGTLLAPDKLDQWDVFAFYTTGILTDPPGTQYKSDQTPAIPQEGKAALLKAIEKGKGFIGFHCATDTFHSPKHDEMLRPTEAPAYVDPYIAMIGGEFGSHGSQQKSMIRVATRTFPGLSDMKDFEMTEEWYSLYNLDPKMHVVLVQDTTTMGTNGNVQAQYRRDPYPATWAKMHGKGPVFYSSMGHREDVWTNPIFQKVLLSGLAFASGNIKADVPSNLKEACPKLAATLSA